jgi:hypothetical protein
VSELKQIKRVEKWEARDGTFHDSLEAAQTYQLMRDLKDALGACKGREEDQARHLLSHFNIVRKGDTPKQPPPPPPLRNPNAGHDHSGVFVWVFVMMLCFAFGILIGWKMHG